MTPYASFCVATYKRPTHLKNTLQQVLAQRESDLEVIVSDNDPMQSGRSVVESLADRRLRYCFNTENVGMIENFNRALRQASGQFVVMLADDDPPHADMLATLRSLELRHPGYACYFGAAEIVCRNALVRRHFGFQNEITAELGSWQADSVKTFTSAEFPYAFLTAKIFPGVLWSAGMISRDVALKAGGIPNYGSPEVADHLYVLKCGMRGGFVAINKVLASLVLHDANESFKSLSTLYAAATTGYEIAQREILQRPDGKKLLPQLQRFYGDALAFKTNLLWFSKVKNASRDEQLHFKREIDKLFELPQFHSARRRFFWKSRLMSYPAIYRLIKSARRASKKVFA